MPATRKAVLFDLTSELVAAYLSQNPVSPGELPVLIASIHATLQRLRHPTGLTLSDRIPVPPVPIKKSITNEYLISMEDGKRYRWLKRHLTSRGLTPDEYRKKWGLPPDYPMVAPTYAKQLSAIAKTSGLGIRRRSMF
jgi:predicted transcriptional regulator